MQTRVIASSKEKLNLSICTTCKLLGLSRQVYYRAIKSTLKRKKTASSVLLLVDAIRMEMPRLGTRKLYHILRDSLKELGVGRDALFRILKANHRLIIPRKKYHVTTNSFHRFHKHKNKIEHLSIVKPEQVWVADITYVGQRNNPMYLSLVTDAYSKKIQGYNVSDSLETVGSLKALKMAIKNRIYEQDELIHHSDRGLQYCSDIYQKYIKNKKLLCSMTESYDPYQNAVAERVNGILKQEFLLNTKNIKLKTMQELVKQSVRIYNQKRPHLSSNMLTPEQMHLQKSIKMKTYKNKNSRSFETSGI